MTAERGMSGDMAERGGAETAQPVDEHTRREATGQVRPADLRTSRVERCLQHPVNLS
jgi:hypothetical protein